MAIPPGQRLQEMEAALESLIQANLEVPILVEGPRDAAALRALGVGGVIRSLHGPESVLEAADQAARETQGLILLTDWDRTGGTLAKRLRDNLAGRVRVDLEHRRRLARWSWVKTVEELPSFVAALRRQVQDP